MYDTGGHDTSRQYDDEINGDSALHPYDKGFWDAYADTNESRYDAEFAGRIIHTISEMRCASVLEVGCGTGIDLRNISRNKTRVCGIDPNCRALSRAVHDMPEGLFVRGMITCMPFADASIDIVFTHRLLNYLDDDTIQYGMHEMYRIAKKHIISCEWFSESERIIDHRCKTRNMSARWAEMGAHVMADIPVHDAGLLHGMKDDGNYGTKNFTTTTATTVSPPSSTPATETRLTLVSK